MDIDDVTSIVGPTVEAASVLLSDIKAGLIAVMAVHDLNLSIRLGLGKGMEFA